MNIADDEAQEIDGYINEDRMAKFNLVPGDRIPTADEIRALRPEKPPDPEDAALEQPMPEARLRRHIFEKAWIEAEATLEDLTPSRIKVAWRLIREFARIKNLIADDDSLAEGLEGSLANVDPWNIPSEWRPAINRPVNNHYMKSIIDILREAENLPADFRMQRYDFTQNVWIALPGMALLPPSIPRIWMDETAKGPVIHPTYDPMQDPLLLLYCRALAVVAQSLRVEGGSRQEPEYGKYGMFGLTDPRLVRLAMPPRMHLIAWEEIIVGETLDMMIKRGLPGLKNWLFDRYGLDAREIKSLIHLARDSARTTLQGDLEEDRGLMLLRLEEYVNRCRNSCDTKSELGALKQMAIILGLSKSEPEDMLKDFVAIAKKVTDERRTMAAQVRERLDSGQSKLVEPAGPTLILPTE